MKVKREGLFTQLYMFTYGHRSVWSLPKNFCTFFWGCFFGILLFPITWISFPFKKCENVFSRFFTSIIIWITYIAITAIAGYTAAGNYFAVTIIGYVLLILLTGVAALGLLAFIVVAISGGIDAAKESDTYANLKEAKQAVKDKYCPRIEWT